MSSSRMMWVLAVPLVALFAAACTDDVTQQQSGTLLRAAFDPSRSLIPTPSDLALQNAAAIDPLGASSPSRVGLMALIGRGGYFTNPSAAPPLSQTSIISFPYELVVEGVATTANSGSEIDPTTVGTSTVAILRVGTPPTVVPYDPIVVATTAGMFRVLPSPGAFVDAGRYVAALRGGPNGVKTYDGRTLAASTPVYLFVNRVNLGDPNTRPASLSPAQAATLQRVQATLVAGFEWDPVLNDTTTCSAVLGIPPALFVEDPPRCWLPRPPTAPAPGAVTPALDAVNSRWPVTEAVSIVTFEVVP